MGVSLAISTTSASAVSPNRGCPAGYEIGVLTLSQGADLMISQDVPATRDKVLARLAEVDRNADGRLCFKDLPETPGIAKYTFQYVDNRAH